MPPQRLPQVNGDDGVWGDIIRQYLMKEHYNDDTNNAANGGHHKVTIRAGTATAGTAPLKFTSGTLLTTPEAGAIEFNADKLYFTKTTGPTRQTVATYDVTGATGDLYYRDSSSNFTRLPIGSTNNVLTVSGGLPAWSAPTVTSTFSDAAFTIQDNGDATKQVKFEASGLTTATTRTITVPDVNGTMYVTGGTDVSVADGGTGRSTSTTAYGIIAAGTTATGAQQTISPGTAGQFLKSAGASALASFASLQLSDLSDASTVATLTGSQTLTGKTINLANNTVTGTLAQFNTALSDADFATTTDLSNKADVSHKYHTFTNGDYYFDDYSHSRYLRLFTENPTYTTTRFKTPVDVEYHDGSTWVAWSGGDVEIKKLLDGREETQSSIDHTHRRFRFKLLANTYPLQTLWLVQTSWSAITFPGVTMKVATSSTQGGTFTLRDTATFNSANGSYNWGMSVYATSTLHVNEPWFQIEIEWTDWTDSGGYTTAPMRRIEILSNYQGGSLLPFSWNWDKQLSGLNKLVLPTGTTNSIGIDFGTDANLYRSGANQLTTDDNLIVGAPGTTTGSVVTIDSSQTLTNKTLTTPVINGIPTGTGVATGPNVSTLVLRDTNGNVSANAFVHGFTSTPTAAGTSTLTITSDSIQEFTGSSTQTVRLPTTSIVAGARYTVINSSTGAVTVQSSGANTVSVLPGGTSATFTALVATPTTAANWESTYINTGDTSSNTTTSVDGEVALFSGTGGKTLKRATGSGIAKLTSGVLSTATAGTDYVTPGGTETLSSKTLTSPVINGTVTGTAVATAATANLLAKWDANKNLFADNFIATYTTTPTATGTTTLTVASTQIQVFTGTSAQTVVLPTTSVVAGTQYRIINNSTGAVTVQSSALNTITILAGNTSGLFTALQAAPTANTHWDGQYWGTAIGSGKTLTVSQSLTLAGTDGTTMTFPSTSGNVVTEGATQTLSAKTLASPTFSGAYSFGGTPTWPTFNQNTTGSAATLTTTRTLQTNLASTTAANFNGSANASIGVTGTLPVANGGTGAATLTGLVKGNGTAAMTAAVAGTDYVTPAGAEALTNKTISGSSNTLSNIALASLASAAYSTSSVASTLAQRDANKNLMSDAFIPGFTTTPTAAGITILTVASTQIQEFTGTSTQTVRLPTTGVSAGAQHQIINSSTGVVTVQSSGANTITSLPAGTTATFTALVATPTTAANWESDFAAAVGDASTNTATSVDNEVVLFSGTGGKTLKRATTTGIAKLTSGVLSAATAGTDYVTPAGTETLSSKTLTSPVINGTVSGTGVATTTTANTLALRDANGNLSANALLPGFTTTATSGITTTLTIASDQVQVFTGASAQTVRLPTTGVIAGGQYRIINNSTGLVTVQSSAGNQITILAANTSGLFMALQAAPTANTHWDGQYWGTAMSAGKTLSVSQSLTLAGTDGTTMTFPSTSGNVVTEGATQTLSAKTLASPTFSGAYSFGGTPTWPTFNQNTTGSAATLTTARTVQTNLASTASASFNGSANITPGVTGTLPVGNGGTGRATATTAYGIIAAGTTATGAQQTIAPGTSGQFLKSAGASALASFASIIATDISDSTSVGRSVLTATDAAAARSAIGAGTGNGNGDVTLNGTQTLTNKTLTNPTVNNYTEGVVAIGTVSTASTLDLTNGTLLTATLTASTTCTFTMPTAVAGKSFVLMLRQAASTGNGNAAFTGVKWNESGAPTVTATAGKMDMFSFFSDGSSWYGSYTQGYTP